MVVMDWEERKESQVIKITNAILLLLLSLNKKGREQTKTFAGQAA